MWGLGVSMGIITKQKNVCAIWVEVAYMDFQTLYLSWYILQFLNCTSKCYATHGHICPAHIRLIPSHPDCNTHSQPGWPQWLAALNLHWAAGKPSRPVTIKAIVAAHKKAETQQVILVELTQNEEIWDYILTAYCLSIVWKQSKQNCHFGDQSSIFWGQMGSPSKFWYFWCMPAAIWTYLMKFLKFCPYIKPRFSEISI